MGSQRVRHDRATQQHIEHLTRSWGLNNDCNCYVCVCVCFKAVLIILILATDTLSVSRSSHHKWQEFE